MVRGFCAGLLALLLAACQNDLNLLEREMIVFKAENERVRVTDLEAEYVRKRDQADRLSQELLVLAKERDRFYADYDKLRAELATLKRQAAEDQNQLATLHSRHKKLQSQIQSARKRQAVLTAELAELEARNRALTAQKNGTKAHG